MADKETKTDETTKATETEAKSTGKEHWGQGGRFRIGADGKRVRKPVKK